MKVILRVPAEGYFEGIKPKGLNMIANLRGEP
jgi:hypothetical protein